MGQEIKKSPHPVEELNYEAALLEIENILDALEGENQDLESALALYERGHALIKHCQGLLENAELKVKMLGEDGQTSDLEEIH